MSFVLTLIPSEYSWTIQFFKADGLNALQAWVIACIFFVFGELFFYDFLF